MANIFQGRARRPDYQARGRIGRTLFDFGAEWMVGDIAAEDARQIGNAEIAMLAEWDELQKAFDASADKPESWDGLFEKEKGRIRTQVMAGATQPGARAKIGSVVDTKFASWKSSIGTAARGQARRNQAVDFGKGMEILNQVPDYGGDVGALQGRIKTTDDYIERQPYLTPNEKLDARRDYRQIQIAGYLLQTGDEGAINNPNSFVTVNDLLLPGFEGEPQEIFGPPEIADLKKRHKQSLAVAQDAVKQQQAADETDFARKLYDPEATAEEAMALRDSIAEIASFDGDLISEWYSKANIHLERLLKPAEKVRDGEYGKLLVRLNEDPDSVSWDEISKFSGDKEDYRTLVQEKEDKSSLLKNPSVNFWFSKLSIDFKKEPVLADKYSRQFRRYFMDYQKLHNKIPSPAEIGDFYDKKFVEPSVLAWLGRAAGSVWTGFTYIHPVGLGLHVSKAVRGKDPKQLGQLATEIFMEPIPIGREKRIERFADDLESGAETRGGYTIGERLEYKVVGFDPITNEPIVEAIE